MTQQVRSHPDTGASKPQQLTQTQAKPRPSATQNTEPKPQATEGETETGHKGTRGSRDAQSKTSSSHDREKGESRITRQGDGGHSANSELAGKERSNQPKVQPHPCPKLQTDLVTKTRRVDKDSGEQSGQPGSLEIGDHQMADEELRTSSSSLHSAHSSDSDSDTSQIPRLRHTKQSDDKRQTEAEPDDSTSGKQKPGKSKKKAKRGRK